MSASYREKLLDPRWQRVRLEKLGACDFTCNSCMDTKSTLHVHHKRYVKGRDPWEYEPHELVVLCKSCHEHEHELKDRISELMCFMEEDGPMSAVSIFAIAAGYMSAKTDSEIASNLCEEFMQSQPIHFYQGRLLVELERIGIRYPAYPEIIAELCHGQHSEFSNEFLALLDKYGMRYEA